MTLPEALRFRSEEDSLGSVNVPADAYWGAQTQRSVENFQAGPQMPLAFIHALAVVKKACAQANLDCGVLSPEKAGFIAQVCDEIITDKLNDQFPVKVYQTGSGTQTNMNMNEVIANRAHVLSGGTLKDKEKILHPNDDVNKSQSSNDVIPTTMHIASYIALRSGVVPAVGRLRDALADKSTQFADVIKSGRTHLMDAVPITVGQELSGWVAQLDHAITTLQESLAYLLELPIGGTAVGSELNAPKDFDQIVVQYIRAYTGIRFRVASNKFHEIAAHGALLKASGALKLSAIDLAVIANNIRLLASGPRTGIGEFILPANEPGSSIMPGKINPTQAEALMQACLKVIGNDSIVSLGGMSGEFQLNVAKPLIIASVLESANLLETTCNSFNDLCVQGITLNRDRIEEHLKQTLMLVTALTPHIGHDSAAKIAQKAQAENKTLKEAALALGIPEADFDTWVDPSKMIGA